MRIDRRLAREAEAVCRKLGITPTAAVSMFFSQMVRVGGLPLRPTEFPALDEYGVTPAQADAAEAAALKEIGRDRKAGRLVQFTGSL